MSLPSILAGSPGLAHGGGGGGSTISGGASGGGGGASWRVMTVQWHLVSFQRYPSEKTKDSHSGSSRKPSHTNTHCLYTIKFYDDDPENNDFIYIYIRRPLAFFEGEAKRVA